MGGEKYRYDECCLKYIYLCITIIFIYFIKIKKTPMRLGGKKKQIMLLIASLYIIYYST